MNSFAWNLFLYDGADPGTFMYASPGTVNVEFVIRGTNRDNVLGRYYDGFKRICAVTADLEKIAVKRTRPGNNGTYYYAEVVIGMTFGSTEIKAAVYWKENVSVPGTFPHWIVDKPILTAGGFRIRFSGRESTRIVVQRLYLTDWRNSRIVYAKATYSIDSVVPVAYFDSCR